jgi:magnesium transporter
MITHYFKQTVNSGLETLGASRAGVWVHVVAPTEEEFATLVAEYGLEDAIVEDINDFFEVPRFEQEGSVAYFFTRFPDDVEDLDIDTAPILIVIGDTFLLTIALQEVPFLTPFINGKRAFQTVERTKLFLSFLTELIVAYDRKLTRIRKTVYRDMGRVRSIRGKDIQRLVFIEQELNEMISALVPTNAWITQLIKGNHIQMFGDDRELVEDLLIDCAQLIDSAQSILKTIQNIRNASEATLTQGLNNTIRTLTGVTIVLTIPTLVSSLFGMNVPLPLEGQPHAFWIVVALILAGVGTTVYFFNRNSLM